MGRVGVESGARVANGIYQPAKTTPTAARRCDAERRHKGSRRGATDAPRECTTSKRFKEPGQHVLPECNAASLGARARVSRSLGDREARPLAEEARRRRAPPFAPLSIRARGRAKRAAHPCAAFGSAARAVRPRALRA